MKNVYWESFVILIAGIIGAFLSTIFKPVLDKDKGIFILVIILLFVLVILVL